MPKRPLHNKQEFNRHFGNCGIQYAVEDDVFELPVTVRRRIASLSRSGPGLFRQYNPFSANLHFPAVRRRRSWNLYPAKRVSIREAFSTSIQVNATVS
jgi:hypothetical protein